MKKWFVGILVLLFTIGIGVTFYLYQYGGLKQYIRAISLINKMPEEEKKKSWDQLNGTDPRGVERGILAGSWLGRVWIWRVKGIRSYGVDEYSVYSLFDGCSDDIRVKLNKGENAISKVLYSDFESWDARAKAGDYVAVYTTKPEQGGIVGNMREIYTYNFWLFMRKGIDSECAK